jgi:hypothetical protein
MSTFANPTPSVSHKRKSEFVWDHNIKTITILVHCDAGADIDDEIAIGFLIRDLETRFPLYDILIIISVKTREPGVERIIRFGGEFTPFLSGLNQTFGFENVKHLEGGKIMTIIFHDGTTFLSADFSPHFILNIAPGLDNIIKKENLNLLLGVSHQGLPHTGNGFNDTNSRNIIGEIIGKGIPMFVTTPFESFDNLFGVKTFKKYGVPPGLHDLIAAEAYKMILGRLSPLLPPNILNFAEGLVNIRLAESLGKPGTNCRLVFAIRQKYTGPTLEVTLDIKQLIEKACDDYLNAITGFALSKGSTTNPITCLEETRGYLIEMTQMLYEMGMPCFDETSTRLRYSSDSDPVLTSPEAFKKFKDIGFFTPAYDLLAAEKLINLMVGVISE